MAEMEKVIEDLESIKRTLYNLTGSHKNERKVDKAIRTIRELQEDCNRYHEWGMHEGYEEAKEKYKCKYWNTEHKECSHGNTIVIDEVCEWMLCDEEANVYDTSCRNPHILIEGTPKENNYEYCPYCGKKIKIVGD